MDISTQINFLREQCPIKGTFSLYPDQLISSIIIRENVSERFGVYIIYSVCNGEKKIVYIGKSGTLLQNGQFKNQGIRQRLRMKQNGVYRDIFFPIFISDRNLDRLEFEWFVTYDDDSKVPPFLVEAQLLAAYFHENGKLPELNRQA